MRFYETRQTIAAPPERVWAILTDAARLTRGFGILKLEGRIAPGEVLRLRSEAAPGREFVLKVTGFEAPRRMVWTAAMPLGLFTGTRVFSLAPVPGGCQFTLREDYTGLMAPVIFKSIPDLTPSFRQFADALRKEAEHD
jgi:hypothetical protein